MFLPHTQFALVTGTLCFPSLPWPPSEEEMRLRGETAVKPSYHTLPYIIKKIDDMIRSFDEWKASEMNILNLK